MKTDISATGDRLARAGSYVLATVLVLMPFHALLTVWLSGAIGHYDVLVAWKDAVLLLMVPLAGGIVWKSPAMRHRLWPRLRGSWLFWAVTAYIGLQLLLGLAALSKGQVNFYALLYAWDIDLRPLLILVLAFILGSRSKWLYRHWQPLLVWPALIVITFGLLQATLLPINILTHFGYSPATIRPFETVDNKPGLVRVQSTLRGPNPLGAYLVLVLAAVLATFTVGGLGEAPRRQRLYGGLLFAAGFIVLLATYSRSAYVGLVLTVMTAIGLAVRSRRGRRLLAAGLAAFALLGAGALVLLRDNDGVQNTLFHTDEHSRSAVSSNQQRTTALASGLHDVLAEPFGRGPGTAGPASVHNLRPARIAEDYYLQIGQETGWLGLGLFVAITAIIGRRLWQLRADPLTRTLLVSLAGISFIGLVQHVWTDDTLALVWWGLSGVALAPRSDMIVDVAV